MNRKPIYESMTKIMHLGYTVRVWSSVSKMPESAGDPSLITHLRQWAVTTKTGDDGNTTLHTDPQQIHDALVKIHEVTAFEILDGHGNGLVTYTEWP